MATRKLEVEFVGDTKDLERAFKRVNKDVDTSGGKFAKFGGAVGAAAKGGMAAAVVAAPLLGGKLISLASDAEETASKFKTVFGKETDSATKALDRFSDATGTSKFALREQAAGFQALIRPMGLTTKGASEMSIGMTKLATDLASFNNTSVEEAITALQSGLVGEAEPLRRFGVQLSAARVEAFAYSHGIAKAGEELTAAEKAQAAYGIILQDTKLAQGDATRTADSFANQFKRLKSQVTDLATELGVKLLPAATAAIGWMTDFITSLQDGSTATGKFGDKVHDVFGVIRDTVGGAIADIRGWFDTHQDDLKAVAKAVENVGKVVAWAWEDIALPVIRRVLPAIHGIVEANFKGIGGLVDILVGILTLDFGRAWDGVKAIFSGALLSIVSIMKGAVGLVRAGVDLIGKAITVPLDAAASAVRHILGQEGLAGWLVAVWGNIRGAANIAWDVVRDHIVGPIQSAASGVRNALGQEGLTGWLSAAWGNIRAGANKAWDVVRDHIVDPIRDAVEKVHALIGNAKEGLVSWLASRWDDITAGVKKMRDGFVGALHDIKDVLAKVVSWLDKAIGFVKDLVSWLPKIKMPDVNPFGGSGGGNVGPAGGTPTRVDGFNDDAARFGNVVTSGFRPGDDGWHGQNRARDYAGGNMLGFAQYMAANFGSKLLELIHTPLGFGIKNGSKVPLSFWGRAVNADHYDHVHVAMARGGVMGRTDWALVGEQGPEVVKLPAGARVFNNRQSGPMLSGGTEVRVFIGERELTDIVRVEVAERDRAAGAAFMAGVA